MICKALTAIALVCITLPGFAQHRKYADEVIASENAFAQLALDSGIKKAFLYNFDPQNIGFNNDKPVNNYNYWVKAPDKGPVILWYPAVAGASANGDLCYDIGPSAIKRTVADTKIVYSGYFFSVWKRNSEGKLKVVLDGGCEKPITGDAFKEAKLTNSAGLPDNPSYKASANSDIVKTDNAFNKRAAKDADNAYEDNVADKSWLIRNNTYAGTSKAINIEHLKGCAISSYQLTTLGSGTASSNDLAYTYGKAALNITDSGAAKNVTGFYYRVWQKFGNKWMIVADMVSY